MMLSNPATFEEAFRSAKREECNNGPTNKDNHFACAIESSLENSLKH